MTRLCQRCGKPVHVGFKFCNVCGEPVNDDGASAGDVVSYSPLLGIRGRTLRVLTGDHAGQFYDAFPAVTVGRNNADIVSADPTVSPVHARLDATESGAQIQDMDSLNGVFVRTKDEKTLLHDNDIIRAGDHLFLFEVIALDRYSEESGTEFYAAPLRGENSRLVEILAGGMRGRACVATDGCITVGRSEGDFVFPDDEKMSPRHFSIRWSQRGGLLIDVAFNGTFVQIHDVEAIARGDIFFIGNELYEMM